MMDRVSLDWALMASGIMLLIVILIAIWAHRRGL